MFSRTLAELKSHYIDFENALIPVHEKLNLGEGLDQIIVLTEALERKFERIKKECYKTT